MIFNQLKLRKIYLAHQKYIKVVKESRIDRKDCKNHVSTMILYNNRCQRKNLTKISTKTKTTRVESYVYKLKWINGPPCAGSCST
jgi:hypothetical protein